VTAIDASVLAPPVVAPPVAAAPAPATVAEAAEPATAVEPTPQGADLQTGLTEMNDGRPGAEANQDTGSINGVTQVQAVAEAAPPLTADDVRNEMARSANERAAVEAEMARLNLAVTASYALIGGLLLLLVLVLAKLLVMKSRNTAALKALAKATAPSKPGAAKHANANVVKSAAPAIADKAPETMFTSAAARAAEKPEEQTQAEALPIAPLAPAPAPIAQTSALSIVPDDVPPQAPAPANDRPSDDEPINRLAELSRLRASGMLTESEFTQLKSAIIATVSRNTVQSP
jgi:hypothetical protein